MNYNKMVLGCTDDAWVRLKAAFDSGDLARGFLTDERTLAWLDSTDYDENWCARRFLRDAPSEEGVDALKVGPHNARLELWSDDQHAEQWGRPPAAYDRVVVLSWSGHGADCNALRRQVLAYPIGVSAVEGCSSSASQSRVAYCRGHYQGSWYVTRNPYWIEHHLPIRVRELTSVLDWAQEEGG